MLKRRYSLAWAALAAVALAGCNSDGGSSSGGSDSDIKVVFIPKNTGNPYFDQVTAGLKDASKTDQIDLDVQGPAEGSATSQLPNIKDAAQAGAKAIVISSNSPDALDQELDSAHGKGIAIITVDSDLVGNETHRDVGILPASPKEIGTAMLDMLAKGMNNQGDFAILSAGPDMPNQNAWIAVVKDDLKDPKYAKMNLVDIVYGNDEPQKSSTEMEGLLTKYPNLKGVLSPTAAGLPAAAQVLENSGNYPGGPNARTGGIILTGLGTPKLMAKEVNKGVVAQFLLWDPALMGKIAAEFAHEIVTKKLEVKPGVTVDVPDVGKVTVGDKNIVYAGPPLTFDKTNVSKYNF
jgi:rhamnose transport system substrate-binding protein